MVELGRIILFIAILFLPFAGLASAAGAESKTVITQTDNGKEITVSEGEVFEVRLEQLQAGRDIRGKSSIRIKLICKCWHLPIPLSRRGQSSADRY